MELIKKPSFTIGYWRPWNDNSNYVESWLDYNKDNQRSKYISQMIIGGFKEINKENIECLKNINSTLYNGFSKINNNLESIENTLYSGFYDLKQNQLKQIQISVASNYLLEDIKILNTISDSTKERYQLVREGLNFISNLDKDEEYFEDAYLCFTKALEIKRTDYFSLFFLGYISTYSRKYFNPNNAIEFFKKSLKYLVIDEDKEIDLINNYYKKVDDNFRGVNLLDSIYLLLSQNYYLNNDNQNALNYSLKISDHSFNANFSYVLKYASRADDKQKIKEIIDKIFYKNILNYEELFCEIDTMSNLFSIEYINQIIIKIESIYNELKIKYENSNEKYEVIDNLKRFFVKNSNFLEKKRFIELYTEDFISNEIKKQISFENEYIKLKNKINNILLRIEDIQNNKESVIKLSKNEKKEYDSNITLRGYISRVVKYIIYPIFLIFIFFKSLSLIWLNNSFLVAIFYIIIFLVFFIGFFLMYILGDNIIDQLFGVDHYDLLNKEKEIKVKFDKKKDTILLEYNIHNDEANKVKEEISVLIRNHISYKYATNRNS